MPEGKLKIFVTGAAGFIGSNLADRLLGDGHHVIGYDNFSTGRREFLAQAMKSDAFEFCEGDLLDQARLTNAMTGVHTVFHMAANADVRRGPEHPMKDLEQNAIGTAHVLEAMRAQGVRRIAFASTGSVYGESKVLPTPENAPFPVQTSLYGASKLAAEGLIAAHCEAFNIQGFIFRFVSILGERYTHGHVIDFYKQLLCHPDRLEILGNGRQRKSYLYVQDCIDAMLLALGKVTDRVTILNLGTDEYCMVDDSVGWITDATASRPIRQYTGGERGWIGDNPFIFLDCQRMRSLGWKPSLTIHEAVERTIAWLQQNHWVLENISANANA